MKRFQLVMIRICLYIDSAEYIPSFYFSTTTRFYLFVLGIYLLNIELL